MIDKPEVRPQFSRRRFIAISAGAAGLAALPAFLPKSEVKTFTWSGVALGAQASLKLEHLDTSAAHEAIAASLAEVARLEAIFSLHREDSALARLNSTGQLDNAPLDLRILLAEALELAERSGGAFDPTVQPLWRLYASHFAREGADPRGPTTDEVATTLKLVNWRRVEIKGAEVRLRLPGMQLTLNGVAQGYITDKVGELLRARGFEHVLVNMGEQLAIGPKWTGSAWSVGISNPAKPERVIDTIEIESGAVATSACAGFFFDSAQRISHIVDARSGTSAKPQAAVTVVAESAMRADGLSTALCAGGTGLWETLRAPGARMIAHEFSV